MPIANGNVCQADLCERVKPCRMLTQSEAERIIGQPARLIKDGSEIKDGRRQCLCAYTGVSKDKASGQVSYLFFSVEQNEVNPSVEQSRQMIETTKEDNAHDASILDLTGTGDEAFLLSSGPDNYFIMARKGSVIMRLQVKNAVGSKTSEELKAFAEKVSKQL